MKSVELSRRSLSDNSSSENVSDEVDRQAQALMRARPEIKSYTEAVRIVLAKDAPLAKAYADQQSTKLPPNADALLAGAELDLLTLEFMEAHPEVKDYTVAFDAVCIGHPELKDRYLRKASK